MSAISSEHQECHPADRYIHSGSGAARSCSLILLVPARLILSRLRGTLSTIDRRRSDGGIGTCTPLEKEYGSGSWLWRPQTHTYLTWNGNAAKWESFRDEIRVWRLGENLNVKYSLTARLVSGLSGPARMTCMTMDADQLHPPPGEPCWSRHCYFSPRCCWLAGVGIWLVSRKTELNVWCPGFLMTRSHWMRCLLKSTVCLLPCT